MSYQLITGATISDLETLVNAAIAGGDQPLDGLQFSNGLPQQAVGPAETTITEYRILVSDNSNQLVAAVLQELTPLQPTGQLVAHGNLLYAPMVDNGGEITDYKILSSDSLGTLFPLLQQAALEDLHIFGDVVRRGNLYLAQVIAGTPAGGGGGGPGETVFALPVVSIPDSSEFNGTAISLYCVVQFYSDEFGTVAVEIIPINSSTTTFDPPDGPLSLGGPVDGDPFNAVFVNNSLVEPAANVPVTITVSFDFNGPVIQKRRVTVIAQPAP